MFDLHRLAWELWGSPAVYQGQCKAREIHDGFTCKGLSQVPGGMCVSAQQGTRRTLSGLMGTKHWMFVLLRDEPALQASDKQVKPSAMEQIPF